MAQQPRLTCPLALVCVAASEDEILLTHWETHLQALQQAGLISVWSERHVLPGEDRTQERQRQVESADLVFLLLSADFFNSPDCLAIMDAVLERSRTGALQVIPLLLRPVAWQESPLANLTLWPSNGVPITQWSDPDAAWHACVQELRRLLGRRVSLAFSSGHPHKHDDSDWERMLRRLRRSYKELLDQSLHGIAWLELGLSTRPDLVSNVTTLLFRLPDGGERLLAPGTKVLDVYDEVDGELLILGAPGAGKSTLLLDLAQQLVSRALADPRSPLPVIFRLSSWALRRLALADWMVEQLTQTYDVPRQLSERWVRQGRILPLLDGLDEMEEAACPACIAAINAYHRRHLVPLVVCSRQAEYEAVAERERLALQSAVIVQSLNDEQIEGYLSAAGSSFAGVRSALHQEQELRELATTPLLLSVLLLTYRGAPASEIIQQGTDLERQVWTDYVTRQVTEKGNERCYPLPRTRAWLSWLAQHMRVHQQTIFSAEYLQDSWLTHQQQHTVMWVATRLPAILLGGCVGLLITLLLLGSTDLVSLLQMGLLGGFVGSRLSLQADPGAMGVRSQRIGKTQAHFRNALLLGLLVAASYGLSLHSAEPVSSDPGYALSDWLRDGCILGLGSLLSGWAFQVLLDRTAKEHGPVPHTHPGLRGRLTAWMNTRMPLPIWQAALVFGAGIGLSVGLSYGLSLGLRSGLIYGLSVGLSDGLIYGLRSGLTVSVIVVLVRVILASTVGALRFAERIHWTWRGLFQPKHLQTSLIVAGASFLFYGLSGLSFGLSEGLSVGLSVGLSEGLSIGLSEGLSAGLHLLFPGMVVMWSLSGGLTILRHYVIRWLLARHHTFPWRAQAFLDDATSRILLRRVGGGYSFIHRRLQDYFADTAAPPSQK